MTKASGGPLLHLLVPLLFRLIAVAATVVATVVMVTSYESVSIFGVTMEAKFQYTPSFRFFVAANIIGCIYSIVALFVPPTSAASRVIVVTDVIIAELLTSAVAAVGALSEVGKNGNSHAGWMPICDQIPKFCDHIMGSLIGGFVAAVVYLIIVLHAYWRVALKP